MKYFFALVALILCWASDARAQGQSYTAGPFTQSGWLYVCPVPSGGTPCPSPSAIFSNAALTVSVSNPILMSAGSTVSFFAASGQYTIQFPASGFSQIINLAGSSSASPGVFNSSFDPPLFQNYTLTSTGAQAAINLTANPLNTHTITFRPSGTVTTCTVALDTSPDSVTWTAGGAISGQTCTSAGEFTSATVDANYVRVNLTTFTGGGTLTVVYSGRLPLVAHSVFGADAAGSAPTHAPVYIAGSDGTNVRALLLDTSGRALVIIPSNATVNPNQIAGVAIGAATLANFPTSQTSTARNVSGVQVVEKSARFSTFSNPAAGSQASVVWAAESAVRHVADCASFSAGSTTAPVLTALTINLRDGASGAGTIIHTWQVVITASTGQNVAPFSVCGLSAVGTTNTAMTLEFSASLTNLIESVSLTGYNVN